MSADILKKLQLKQKQQQRHSKQNVTITNLYANKLVQSKPIFRVMPSTQSIPIAEPVSIILPVLPIIPIIPIIPIVKPIVVESLPDIIIEESANINTQFNLQYIKSKIMADYSHLYKTA